MKGAAAVHTRGCRDDGQVVPLVALSLVVLLGFAAIVIDIGRLFVAQQQLQGAVNAAALVAGQNLPNASGAYTAASAYSGAPGAKNAFGGYGVTANAPNVTFECLSHADPNYTAGSTVSCPTDTSTANCQPPGAQPPQPSGTTTCNAVKVTETATVNTTLGRLFFPGWTISASAIAAARGGASQPINAYVILDNSYSMTSGCSGSVTGNGNPTSTTISNPEKIDCAKAGVRALLQALAPCSSTLSSCGSATSYSGTTQLGANVAAPVDEVGLLVTPALTSATPLADEIDCNTLATDRLTAGTNDTYPPWTAYTYASGAIDGGIPSGDNQLGYQAVALSSDYRSSFASTTLSWTSSDLVRAVDWGQCPASNYPGGDYYGLKIIDGEGSYLAGAITEAQYLLVHNARPGAQNAIIIESDGELNDPRTFSDTTPCQDAVSAATQAKAAGTTIYSIAYNTSAAADSCGTGGHYPPAPYDVAQTVMQDIASSSSTFYPSPTAGDLTTAFHQVGTDLTDSRLIPDCTAAPPNC